MLDAPSSREPAAAAIMAMAGGGDFPSRTGRARSSRHRGLTRSFNNEKKPVEYLVSRAKLSFVVLVILAFIGAQLDLESQISYTGTISAVTAVCLYDGDCPDNFYCTLQAVFYTDHSASEEAEGGQCVCDCLKGFSGENCSQFFFDKWKVWNMMLCSTAFGVSFSRLWAMLTQNTSSSNGRRQEGGKVGVRMQLAVSAILMISSRMLLHSVYATLSSGLVTPSFLGANANLLLLGPVVLSWYHSLWLKFALAFQMWLLTYKKLAPFMYPERTIAVDQHGTENSFHRQVNDGPYFRKLLAEGIFLCGVVIFAWMDDFQIHYPHRDGVVPVGSTTLLHMIVNLLFSATLSASMHCWSLRLVINRLVLTPSNNRAKEALMSCLHLDAPPLSIGSSMSRDSVMISSLVRAECHWSWCLTVVMVVGALISLISSQLMVFFVNPESIRHANLRWVDLNYFIEALQALVVGMYITWPQRFFDKEVKQLARRIAPYHSLNNLSSAAASGGRQFLVGTHRESIPISSSSTNADPSNATNNNNGGASRPPRQSSVSRLWWDNHIRKQLGLSLGLSGATGEWSRRSAASSFAWLPQPHNRIVVASAGEGSSPPPPGRAASQASSARGSQRRGGRGGGGARPDRSSAVARSSLGFSGR